MDEIALCFEIRQNQSKERIKTLAWLAYNNAMLVAIGINNPKQFPSLEEAFPGMFEGETQQDWRVTKQRIEQYAASVKAIQHNKSQ